MLAKTLFENTVSPWTEMLAYEALWGIPNQTERTLRKFFDEYKTLPSKTWEILIEKVLHSESFKTGLFTTEQEWSRDKFDEIWTTVEGYLSEIVKENYFSIAIHGSFQYPKRVLDAPNFPLSLFYFQGDISFTQTKTISVVGSRKVSDEGKIRARKLSKLLVDNDYTIVSGLAAGVDTEAMTTTRDCGGRLIGVIGTPLSETYPKENIELQKEIGDDHLLISQIPFFRYKNEPFKVKRRYFPARNETMAAISDATVIVEAGESSGTLTQARACMQQGRRLFILNSCFENSDLTWPSKYEARGAVRVRDFDDILSTLEADYAVMDESRESGCENGPRWDIQLDAGETLEDD